MLFVFQVNRLNAKIEKPPGVTNVLDDTYYYVGTQKRPLEAVGTPMMGGKHPRMHGVGGPTTPRSTNSHEIPSCWVIHPKLLLQL